MRIRAPFIVRVSYLRIDARSRSGFELHLYHLSSGARVAAGALDRDELVADSIARFSREALTEQQRQLLERINLPRSFCGLRLSLLNPPRHSDFGYGEEFIGGEMPLHEEESLMARWCNTCRRVAGLAGLHPAVDWLDANGLGFVGDMRVPTSSGFEATAAPLYRDLGWHRPPR